MDFVSINWWQLQQVYKKNNLGDLAIEKFFEARNKIENSYNQIIEFKKLI